MKLVNLANSACVFTLLIVMGLPNPSPAFSQTRENTLLEEPKRQESAKTDFAFKSARILFWSGVAADVSTTMYTLGHPTVASQPDGRLLGTYYARELNPPGNLFGGRNRFAVAAMLVGQDFLIDLAARKMRRRGGVWGKAATGLLALEGANGIRSAFSNMKKNAGVDERVRATAAYPSGRIVWSH